MGLVIDIHVHTSRYSTCSQVDPARLIGRAVKAGLNGVVIMEHHKQWDDRELRELVDGSGHPGFLLLSGFEYASAKGDLLIYGLDAEHVAQFEPGGPPDKAVQLARSLGGVCIAAHPTRAGLGFDDQLLSLPLVAIEVCSVNLQTHEQRLAMKIAEGTGIAAVAASDAHRLDEVGRYATVFEDAIQSMAELQNGLKNGRFRLTDAAATGINEP